MPAELLDKELQGDQAMHKQQLTAQVAVVALVAKVPMVGTHKVEADLAAMA
jgi:hypothetical protein